MVINRVGVSADTPVLEAAEQRLDLLLRLLDARLGEAEWLAGDALTAADIISVFPLTTMRLFQPYGLGRYPNIRAYLQRVGARPAYMRAMQKGDPDMTPRLV
jgi:glutathione S-transferase